MAIYDKYPLIDGTFFLSPRQHSSNGNSVPVVLKSPILSSSSLLNTAIDDSPSSSSSKSSSKSSISKPNHGQGHGHHQKGGGRNQNSGQKGRSNSKSGGGGKGSSASSFGALQNVHESSSGTSSSASSSACKSGLNQFLQAVCMSCLEGWRFRIQCRSCHRPWIGSNLTLGSMYSYDIFAALPCCVSRYTCNGCSNPIMSPDRRLEFFSDYSQRIPCPTCGLRDHHFVKPLGITFTRTF